jgi:hypothetical protein
VKRVTFNETVIAVPDGVLTYARICALSGIDPLHEPTVKYKHVSGTGGILSPGDKIVASDGLVFTVRKS